jgi:hypothetical protein
VEGRSIDSLLSNPLISEIIKYLSSFGYVLYSFNNLNSIFVDPKFLNR